MAAWTKKLSAKWGVKVQIDMVDIRVRPHLDLTKASVQKELLNKISSGFYAAIILSPPCSTFTRATFSNRRGPRPVRSYVHLRGHLRLTWTERRKANWGNSMTDFSFQVCKLVQDMDTIVIFENPEDLGAVQVGPYAGQRPASMWQWPLFLQLIESGKFQTCAFYQSDYGTEYLKPTRLLLKGLHMDEKCMKPGLPCFDEQGFYQGPLERRQATVRLIGHQGGKFTTTGTEQWPSSFCKWVATQILTVWSSLHTISACGGGSECMNGVEEKVGAESFPVMQPEGWKLNGGHGEPRQCKVPGKTRMFHDGSGLASPGRWDLEKRVWNRDNFWNSLREDSYNLVLQHCGGQQNFDRICFEMAAKGEEGCKLVKNDALSSQLVQLWCDGLHGEGYNTENIQHVAEGQPFKLRLMEALLDRAGDPDHKFLLQGESGYPVGVLHPLPRTPHMYEEQTSWKLEDDPYMKAEIWRNNYDSVGDHEEFVREHFAEECKEGLMEKLTLEQAHERFGSKVAISSLAVLVEESHGNKKRIIHDATHGTKVNNRIRCRDKQRSPGAREKMYLLAYYKARGDIVFSLVGDISKAHRRFLHEPSECGLLACRVKNDDPFIFINKVGTFGVASASYWWGRIAASGIRLTHELLGPERPIEMLIFADDLESLGAGIQGRRGIVLSYLYLATMGFPFKWSKQRGGLKVEWIGLFTDYTTMRLGLSESRAAWMENWTRKMAQTGRTTSKEMEQGLGRLGFAANALTWERPFLGPLYAWSAAVRTKKGLLKIPAMLRTIFWFLAKRTRDGGSLQEPTPIRTDNEADLVFFTDAKATEQGAWIGGFLQSKEGSIISWFSEEVQESWAPWLFVRKDPKRVIAALELLATLVAVRLWANGLQRGGKGRCWVRAGTDNQGNSYAVSRLMSTKYPLTVLIMELSETLRARNCELDLQWIPREKNQLADDLTNQVFTKFPMDCRVQFVGGDTKWLVLSELMEKANEFHMELAAEKKRKVAEPVKTRKAKKQKLLEPW